MGCCCTSTANLQGIEDIPLIGTDDACFGRIPSIPKAGQPEVTIPCVSEENEHVTIPELEKVILIMNPFSGNGLANQSSKALKGLMEAASVDVVLMQSTHAGQITEIAQERDFSEFSVIIVCGGDGSLMEFMTGYMPRKLDIPVAICPGGTGNTLAASLGILDAKDCAESILSRKCYQVDCILVTESEGEKRQFYSHNVIGLALGYDLNECAENIRCCGQIRYTLCGLSLMCCCYGQHATIRFNDEVDVEGDITFMFIQNNNMAGGKSFVAPYSKIDDGMMDVIICPKTRMPKALEFADNMDRKGGSHVNMEEVTYIRTKLLEIKSQGGVNIDGENVGLAPCKLEVLPKSWKIMCKGPSDAIIDVKIRDAGLGPAP